MRRTLIAAALTLCIAPPLSAQTGEGPFLTGNGFARQCETTEWKVGCVTYVLGLFHGSQSQRMPDAVCLPTGVDTGQLYEVAVKYIKSNPAIAHRAAFDLILESWEQAFPCV